MSRATEIRRVLLLTLFLNLSVAGVKIAYGYWTYSVAITSDGFHSLFDAVSNIAGLASIRISSPPPDEMHPYGHRKYETVFTIFVGVLMFVTFFEILKNVYASLQGKYAATVTTESFLVMLATLLVNLFVVTYERRVGRRLGSEFLIADALHTRSDVIVTLGVLAGLGFIRLGFPLADPLVGIVVGLFIAKTGLSVIRESTETLVDRTQADISAIRVAACSIPGVEECHDIRTRGPKNYVFVDLHVLVLPSLSVEDAHRIADRVEEEIKSRVPEVVDVVVHIEPSPPQ
ncbi:MAG: cation diffusion facilitator family transporter [Alphaproteobacteria bacterium]|uniref:Cation diffusion facilitator family transporter n=1 Tax=Candidatus Nitrobium versatile TaxID=2884831 RepID=A0A953J4G4_9BACT|nr:cation diffusion facilitator family transporter [Candidatus Nitrobium versatile]